MAEQKTQTVYASCGFSGNGRNVEYELVRIEDNENGRSYAVVVDGKRLGTIARENATFERKSKNHTFVNARWQSLRWFGKSEVDPTARLYQFDKETRAGAAKEVIEAWLRHENRKAEGNA